MKILVFAGGNGTRLWPVSRITAPKQFQKLIGEQTLFQLTIKRFLKKFSLDDIYIVVPEIYKNEILQECPQIPASHILIEPCKWDTLACIGYALSVIAKSFPDENVFCAWSDHMYKDENTFLQAVYDADQYATVTNKIVKFGQIATYPETNWGYIKKGNVIKDFGSYSLDIFEEHIEKPDKQKAQTMLTGEYLWNLGYILAPVKTLMGLYKQYVPNDYHILEQIINTTETQKILDLYQQITKTSIDYAILEKANKDIFAVMSLSVGWNDVGDWGSLKKQLESDPSDVVIVGNGDDVFSINTTDTIVYQQDRKKVVCLLDVDDLAIVDTKDVLLVCKKEQAKIVKKIVEEMMKVNQGLC